MAFNIPLTGLIEPRAASWSKATAAQRLAFYRRAGDLAEYELKRQLLNAIGADGDKMMPRQKPRRDGASGPVMDPHFGESRTLRLLDSKAWENGLTLFWHGGVSKTQKLPWSQILAFHAQGLVIGAYLRDVRLAPSTVKRIADEMNRWWRKTGGNGPAGGARPKPTRPVKPAPVRPVKPAPGVPTFKTWEGARDWAKKNLKTPVKVYGGNLKIIQESVEALAEVERRTGGALPKTTVVFTRPPVRGAYGQATYDPGAGATTIHIDPSPLTDPESARERDNAKWEAERGTGTPYHSTTSVAGVVWHEAGHALDAATARTDGDPYGLSQALRLSPDEATDKEKLAAMSGVSGYAVSDWYATLPGREAFAEAFAAIATNSPQAPAVPGFAREVIARVLK